jgi:hypothetical protein
LFHFFKETQTRVTRATGDLLSIGVARIAIGKRVFKSKCQLMFQLGTRRPYMVFAFNNDAKPVQIKVSLSEDDLMELAYYVADDAKEESEEYDDSMSIIAFRVIPSQSNTLVEYADWYDGADPDDSDTSYITIELRDKEEFQVSDYENCCSFVSANRILSFNTQ